MVCAQAEDPQAAIMPSAATSSQRPARSAVEAAHGFIGPSVTYRDHVDDRADQQQTKGTCATCQSANMRSKALNCATRTTLPR